MKKLYMLHEILSSTYNLKSDEETSGLREEDGQWWVSYFFENLDVDITWDDNTGFYMEVEFSRTNSNHECVELDEAVAILTPYFRHAFSRRTLRNGEHRIKDRALTEALTIGAKKDIHGHSLPTLSSSTARSHASSVLSKVKLRYLHILRVRCQRQRLLLKDALGTIEALVDQQAMPDDFYEDTLTKLRQELGAEET